jgi:hypothetical protein
MNKQLRTACGIAAFLTLPNQLMAQEAAPCRTSVHDATFQTLPAAARLEQEQNELFTQQYLQTLQNAKSSAVDTYRVALVFHVYGTTQGAGTLSDTLIQSAVKKLNDDFHGLNNDFNLVHSQFMPLRGKKNIKFYLAKKRPNGSPTTGIIYYPTTSGYGNGSGYDAQIAADAWDNYKYINIYVQHDMYNDGSVYNSGVAWYPNTWMSDNGLARIVYNGAYLGSNTDDEFASVLTHEMGHFLNLIHTFEGGCTNPNDNVADTPPCTTAQGCHTNTTTLLPLNCNNQLVNSENYMDYNSSCYRMFTLGQAARIEAALQLPSRITLWQDSTMSATGIYTPASVGSVTTQQEINVYPNPTSGNITIEAGNSTNYDMQVINSVGQTVYEQTNAKGNITIDLSNNAKGLYFIQLRDNNGIRKTKVLVY